MFCLKSILNNIYYETLRQRNILEHIACSNCDVLDLYYNLYIPLMNIKSRILAWIVLLLGLIAYSQGVFAQNVVRKGHVFVQQSASKDSVKTDYEYQDRDGNKYVIYLSPKGKAYYWAVSKKTGKRYKRYLPKITEMLKEADNEKAKGNK